MTATAAPAVDAAETCLALARKARAASRAMANVGGVAKDRWLRHAADLLLRRGESVLQANALDLDQAERRGTAPPQLDRLRITPQRLEAMADALREIATLADPVGQVRESRRRPNGLEIHKVGVPLGVILFIYESRPNVTVDAAALCVKSGNAVLLRGGHEAAHSNAALAQLLQLSLAGCRLPPDAVQMVSDPDRAAVGHLLKMSDQIDLVIPRGGEGLIRRVVAEARMPVLKHYKGNCHVYVEKSADPERALAILIDGKCQRPGVCNATESVLVDRAVAPAFLPRAAAALAERGVELRGCPETRALVPQALEATEEDFAAEYLDLVLSIKVVGGVEEAAEHIARYGSGHTETIVTNDLTSAHRFTALVDSSVVLVNASTRFNDGGELGLGAEIGISTDKFHARGPCGLLELTSYKYVVWGDGQVRG
jgi:glutamate-5-semialdehyde dehydrogenase